ncbi:MAG: 30S ribosomal protein S5 [Proteobacteria bacterium]|nr:30S ribosomal protein S5 [Pseudomonadota bacterium]
MSKETKEPRKVDERDNDGLQDRVVHIARVAKVVKGGRRFSFSALVVVGDGREKVGFGLGKASEVPDAIRKASEQAKKNMTKIPMVDGTIPFDVTGKFGSARVIMFPAKKGKGIIAGGAVRILVELGGVQDIICKVHGTKNHQNVVRAAMDGLKQLMLPEQYAAYRGKVAEETRQIRQSKSEIRRSTKVAASKSGTAKAKK